ncbi:hypothetical protein NQ317_008440 [Molorchus minor]|uniref:Uncharacterized protein n=1 Tax=Molorchus minor TaxID=1323400 RepID=A0ABQ9JFC4_9CUCU|nr:hypothetical protein NQ317_008440 [Molorchus minor]
MVKHGDRRKLHLACAINRLQETDLWGWKDKLNRVTHNTKFYNLLADPLTEHDGYIHIPKSQFTLNKSVVGRIGVAIQGLFSADRFMSKRKAEFKSAKSDEYDSSSQQAEDLIQCRDALMAGYRYYIRQLTDLAESNSKVNNSWDSILAHLDKILSRNAV